MKRKNVLFTGPPGCGKSTIIEKIVTQIKTPCTGFFTREIREKGRRMGFSISTMDGKHGVLAHKSIKSPYRVGNYGVNLEDINRIAVPSISPASRGEMVVIDEIGKMECVSTLFRVALVEVLNSENRVLGSISLRGDAFIRNIQERKDVHLIRVSEKNRDALVKMFA